MTSFTEIKLLVKPLFRYVLRGDEVWTYVCGNHFKVIPAVKYDAASGSDLCSYIKERGESFRLAYLNWLSFYRGSNVFEGDVILDRETQILVKGIAMTSAETTMLISYITSSKFVSQLEDKYLEVMDLNACTSVCGIAVEKTVVENPTLYKKDEVSPEDKRFASACIATSRMSGESINTDYTGNVMSFVHVKPCDENYINVICDPAVPGNFYNLPRVVFYFTKGHVPITKLCPSFFCDYFELYYWGVDMDHRLLPPRKRKFNDVWSNFYSPDHVYHVMDERGKNLLMQHSYWGACPVVSPDTVYNFERKDVPRSQQICMLTDVMRKGHAQYLWVETGKICPFKYENVRSSMVVPQGILIRLGKFVYTGRNAVRCVETGEVMIKALSSESFVIKMKNFTQLVSIRVIKPRYYRKVIALMKNDPKLDTRRYEVAYM